MNTPLRCLIVEDSEDDALLVLRQLRDGGYDVTSERVDTPEAMHAALAGQPWDIVISDYKMPRFSGTAALELLKASGLDLPFIIVSGTIGEDQAVTAMKAGTHDYLMKGKLARLVPAVQRELRDARVRCERRQAEDALHASQQLIEGIINAMPVSVFWKDKNLVFLGCNTAFARDAGFAGPKDIIGKTDCLMVWREQAELYRDDDRKIIASGQSKLIFEETQTTPAGKTITVLSSKLALRNANGEIIGLLGTYMDITERKHVEAERQRLVAILEATPDFVGFSDPAGHVQYMNQAARKMLGFGPEEDVTKFTIAECLPDPANNIVMTEGIPTAIRDGQWSGEMVLLSRSGKRIPGSQVILAHKSTDGKLEFLSTIIRDITARKLAEESHARLAMAVEQADETIVITDTDAKILYVNPAFEKISSYTYAEVIGQNPRILKSGKQDAEFYRRMWETLKHGEVWQGHFINRRKDGKLYEEKATISPLRDATGNIVNYVAVKHDLTREMELEAQFRQSQKMEAFGQLAGGVAHDFNNILAIILLQAGLLKSEEELSPRQLECAGEIEKSAERAANLTRQLLLFSRKQTLQPHDLNLKDVVANMTKMLRRTLGEQVQLLFKFSEETLFLHADPGMIDQILLNLTVNARDAMPKGGQILIETAAVEFDEITAIQHAQARPGSFVCLSVSDTGGGIPPEILPRIFEPFFTTKDVGKGTGLGLATVYGIVQQHKGWIHVYSVVGRGTTFRVYLPRLTQAPDKKADSSLAAIRGGSETILLVEDEFAVRGTVRTILSRQGYRVLEASKGAEALEVWNQNRGKIHLLLTDMVMPGGMNGIEVAAQLLRQDPKLKVIYSSGYSAEIAGKDILLEEGVNFLAKPYQAHLLAQTIRASLDKPA